MKLTRSVFILLIGMISLTAFATTSKPDQKPKVPIHVDSMNVSMVAINVVDFNAEVVFVFTNDFSSTSVTGKEYKPNTFAILNDVGWSPGYLRYETLYKEKLSADYNKDFVHRMHERNISHQGRSNC